MWDYRRPDQGELRPERKVGGCGPSRREERHREFSQLPQDLNVEIDATSDVQDVQTDRSELASSISEIHGDTRLMKEVAVEI
jgi:hypothetical protein